MQKRTRLLIGITSLIILVLGGYMLVRYFNGPATGTVQVPYTPPPTTSTKKATYVTVDGTYASFRIPNTFSAMPAESIKYPTVESFSYQYKQTAGSSWRLSISINNVSNASSGQSTSYELRASKPNQYALSSQTSGGKTYAVMTETGTGQFSKVAYSKNGVYVADISLQGGSADQEPELQRVFDELLASWQWK